MRRLNVELWTKITTRTPVPPRADATATAKPKPAPRQAAKTRADATTTKPPRIVAPKRASPAKPAPRQPRVVAAAKPPRKSEAQILTDASGTPLCASNWLATNMIRENFELGAPHGVAIKAHRLRAAGEPIQKYAYFIISKTADSATPMSDVLTVARAAVAELAGDKHRPQKTRSPVRAAAQYRATWGAIRTARAQAK